RRPKPLLAFHRVLPLRKGGPGTMCRIPLPASIAGSSPGSASYSASVLPRLDGTPLPFASQRGVKSSIECGRSGSAKEQSLSPPPYCCRRQLRPPSSEAKPSLSPVLSEMTGPRSCIATPAMLTHDSELTLRPRWNVLPPSDRKSVV